MQQLHVIVEADEGRWREAGKAGCSGRWSLDIEFPILAPRTSWLLFWAASHLPSSNSKFDNRMPGG